MHKSIQKLNNKHKLENFDCGIESLNKFLINHALSNQNSNSVNTYVGIEEDIIIGFYSLVVGSVFHAQAPSRIVKGLAKYPIPVMILARLAVSKMYQSQGAGKGLLKDALLRTVQASDIAGIRALLVHAKDDQAKSWYQQFGFEQSPSDNLHLFLLMKDLKKLI